MDKELKQDLIDWGLEIEEKDDKTKIVFFDGSIIEYDSQTIFMMIRESENYLETVNLFGRSYIRKNFTFVFNNLFTELKIVALNNKKDEKEITVHFTLSAFERKKSTTEIIIAMGKIFRDIKQKMLKFEDYKGEVNFE